MNEFIFSYCLSSYRDNIFGADLGFLKGGTNFGTFNFKKISFDCFVITLFIIFFPEFGMSLS